MDTLIIDSQFVESIRLGAEAIQDISDTLPGGIRQVVDQLKPVEEDLGVKDWVEIVAAIATGLTFIYLLIQDYRKSKKIDHLARLAEEAQKQTSELKIMAVTLGHSLRLKMRSEMPYFKHSGRASGGGELHFNLTNIGKEGTIYEFLPEEIPGVIWNKLHNTQKVKADEVTNIVSYRIVDQRKYDQTKNQEFSFTIKFESQSGIKYSQIFKLRGGRVFEENAPERFEGDNH